MSGPGARRAAVLAREARRLDGNRLWRIETPAGPLLQKYYVEKGGRLRSGWRSAWSRLLRGATGSGAAERWRVEGETLAHWRAAGVDVPADRTAEFPRYAGERVRLLEWIEGRTLAELLAGAGLAGEERSALLRRAAAAWGRGGGAGGGRGPPGGGPVPRGVAELRGGGGGGGEGGAGAPGGGAAAGGRRLVEAVRRDDARLVQFHGGFMHLLVAGERIVAIDLEQAYLPGRPVAPRLAREVATCVRGLAGGREPAALRADLEALVAGFPDRALLAAAAERALHPARPRTAAPLRELRCLAQRAL